jgi:hypothetical protein
VRFGNKNNSFTLKKRSSLHTYYLHIYTTGVVVVNSEVAGLGNTLKHRIPWEEWYGRYSGNGPRHDLRTDSMKIFTSTYSQWTKTRKETWEPIQWSIYKHGDRENESTWLISIYIHALRLSSAKSGLVFLTSVDLLKVFFFTSVCRYAG